MDRSQQPYLPPYEQSQAMHNANPGHGYPNPIIAEGNPGYPAYGFVAPGPGFAAQGPANPGYPHPSPALGTGYSTGQPSNPNYPQAKAGGYPGVGDATVHQPSAPVDHGQYPQQFQQAQFVGTTHTFVPVIVASEQRLGPQSCSAACPKCGEQVRTTARSSPNMLAWLSCSLIAVLGCFWGCCLIPFCIEPCQDVHHSCPQCNTYLGKFSRLR